MSAEAEGRVEQLQVRSDLDVVLARNCAKKMAAEIGFRLTDQVVIATATSEIVRNAFQYAGKGHVLIERLSTPRAGISVIVKDTGPGLDLAIAMRDGYSTSRGMGVGLPGAKRLMDVFTITSVPGQTEIKMVKWLP